MAVPKRKMSRSNTRHRRSQWKASVPTLVTCENPACREKHLPHVACPSCGQPVESLWQICPYCATEIPSTLPSLEGVPSPRGLGSPRQQQGLPRASD